jgi:ribosomal protein L40E
MQNPLHEIEPQAHPAQALLRLFGPLLMGLGAVLTVIGIFSYFSSLRTLKPPRYLWGVMVGLPLVGIGASFGNFGRDGEILRSLAEEVSPVAQGVGLGLTTARNGDVLSESGTTLCGRCDASNPADAKFCNQCGTSLLNQNCPECGASITPSARFCNQCGKLVE